VAFRTLHDEQELEQFSDHTERYLSLRLPRDYLEKGKVVACYSDEGDMVGGYALILKPPFRAVELIPEEVRSGSSVLKRIPGDSMFEINGLWLSPRARKHKASFRLWIRLYCDAIRTGKSHFIYAYDLDNGSLERLYSICRPEILFRGQVAPLPGMLHAERLSIEVSSVARAALFPLRRPGFLLGRLLAPR
jgi:hypothetical protein